MEPLVRDLVGKEKEKYSIGKIGDMKEVGKFDLVKEILKFSKEAAKINFEEKTSTIDVGSADENAQIEKYAKENDVSYSEAYRTINRKD
jgi:hypothetical protein